MHPKVYFTIKAAIARTLFEITVDENYFIGKNNCIVIKNLLLVGFNGMVSCKKLEKLLLPLWELKMLLLVKSTGLKDQ